MADYKNMSVFEGIEEFFQAIKEKCSDDKEYAAELLKARGFLLEDNEFALSDNSFFYRKNKRCSTYCFNEYNNPAFDDANYLNELLTKENIGEVQGNKIIIFPDANVEKIFYKDFKIGGEAGSYEISWDEFLNYEFVPKIPVRLLEPFIARYIKAISACGVATWCSCDGNHQTHAKFNRILIDFVDTTFEWHKMIFEKCLAKKFKLNFEFPRCNLEFKFPTSDKWKAYIELNRAAEFLYNNRKKIRQIKSDTIKQIAVKNSRRQIAKISVEEFYECANKFLDNIF